MKSIKLLFVIAALSLSVRISAQGGGSMSSGDARSASMGKTYTSSSFGLYALGVNPANLFNKNGESVEFFIPLPIPHISGQVGTNFATLDDYNYFFGTSVVDPNDPTKKIGRTLTDADKTRLSSLFADGGSIYGNIQVQIFAISIKPADSFGTFAFTIGDVISSNVTFPKGIVDLGLYGNTLNQVYNFNDTQLQMWWLRKYSFSFARELEFVPMFKSFSMGVSLNMIQGFAYAGIDHIGTQLQTSGQNVISGQGDFLAHAAFSPDFHVRYDFDMSQPKQDASASPFPTPAGSGFGFDIGFSAKLDDVWSFGLALTDVGSVTWNKNVAEFTSNKAIYLDNPTDQAQLDTLKNRLTGKNGGKYISSINTQLATAIRFGASMQLDRFLNGNFPGKMLIAFDFNKGFNDQPTNSTKPRFSVGADWVLGFFSLRSGVSFGGYDKFNWGAGFGLDFGALEINMGSADFQSAVSQGGAKRITFAFDSRWKF